MNQIFFFLILPTLISIIKSKTVQTKSTASEGEVNIDNGTAMLSWVIAGNYVTFTFEARRIGWWGIGFGRGMIEKDMFIIEINDGGEATITDLWSAGETTPIKDFQQDFTLISQSVTDNSILVTFKRNLDTGDADQDSVLTIGQKYTWSYAYSSEKQMSRRHSSIGMYTVQFGENTVLIDNQSSTSQSTLNFDQNTVNSSSITSVEDQDQLNTSDSSQINDSTVSDDSADGQKLENEQSESGNDDSSMETSSLITESPSEQPKKDTQQSQKEVGRLDVWLISTFLTISLYL